MSDQYEMESSESETSIREVHSCSFFKDLWEDPRLNLKKRVTARPGETVWDYFQINFPMPGYIMAYIEEIVPLSTSKN
ncbi:hypothetical protein [Peribacillus sp. FSL R5-0717]|uniref:hypothetical protein n=1 Tax=Peribacillus sp. FSL R5-0717 TaxID=2975308 RepID=UPI0030F8ACF1